MSLKKWLLAQTNLPAENSFQVTRTKTIADTGNALRFYASTVSSLNTYRKGVRLIRKDSTFGTRRPVSFERNLRDFTLTKTSPSQNSRSRMHVQDLAAAQIVAKCRVAKSTRSVITESSANFRHNSILANNSLPLAGYETSPSNIPRFDLRVLYTVQSQGFLTEEMFASSFHFLSWAR